MKKKNLLLTCMLTATLALGITACSQLSGVQDEEFSTPQNSEQSYAFSAISAANIISAMGVSSQSSTAPVKAAVAASSVTDEATISSLNEYMSIVESVMSDGSYGVDNETSDREGYSVKTTLSFSYMSGEKGQYVMYYNEVNVSEYTEIDDGETEVERKAAIEGVLVIEGVDYAISGVTVSETEGNESEWETRFTVTLSQTSYIIIKQESEEEFGESEFEYEYSLYEGGSLVTKSVFKFEQEDDETEIEIVLTENGSTQKFYFEKETERGVEYITIKVGSANATEKYRVYINENADGTYSYSYVYIG